MKNKWKFMLVLFNRNNDVYAGFLMIVLVFQVAIIVASPEVTVDRMIGEVPLKFCWLQEQFKSASTQSCERVSFKNKLILYGLPGNGKSMLARKFAQLSDSKLYELDGPSIVRRYVGQGVENIEILFEEVLLYSETQNKKVVVFVDEIDAIANNNAGDANFRSEHIAALQKLWLYLDKCKYNPNIFFIGATNHFDELDKTFLDRFGGNVIEIKNPDNDLRRKIIEHYFGRQKIELSASFLNELVKSTNDFSIRSLEDLAGDVHMAKHFSNSEQSVDDLTRQAVKDIKKKMVKPASKNPQDSLLQKTNSVLSIAYCSLGLMLNICTIASKFC